jgi:hypothetical protein
MASNGKAGMPVPAFDLGFDNFKIRLECVECKVSKGRVKPCQKFSTL